MSRILAGLLLLLLSSYTFAASSSCDTAIPAEHPSSNTDEEPAHILYISTVERLIYTVYAMQTRFDTPTDTTGTGWEMGVPYVDFGEIGSSNVWAVAVTAISTEPETWFVTGTSQFMCFHGALPVSIETTACADPIIIT